MITKNSKHAGIRVGNTIFRNINYSGVSLKTWINDLGIRYLGFYPSIFKPF
ncbi:MULTISPECIES: papain fold toxin domain-containing protein [Neisseria]|uniref:papain fold toxin domain-containing protein n=1 Tax=Neisseria sicca TaxID=490 RepID=UPI00114CCDB7